MITRQPSLSKNIVHFCRFLRQKSFNVSIEEETLSLQSLQFIDYSNNEIFHLALKASICRNKSQLDEFDNLFHEYWKELDKAVDAKTKEDPKNKTAFHQQPSYKAINKWLHGNGNKETEIKAPENKVPAGAMPQTREEPNDKQIPVYVLSVTTQGEIQVVPEKRS